MIFRIKEIEEFKNFVLIFESLSKNTLSSYFLDLRQFEDFLIKSNIMEMKNFSKKNLYDFFFFLEKLDLSKRSFARKQSSIKKFLKFCVEKEMMQPSEFEITNFNRIKSEKRLPKFLTNEEIKKIIEIDISKKPFLNLRNKLIVMILYSSGMRVSELCNLKLKNFINLEKNKDSIFFTMVNGKGRKERFVPIYQECVSILSEYLSLISDKLKSYDFLFSKDGKKSITRRMVLEILKKKARLAGIFKNVSPHILRHSFATYMLQNGLDIKEIQDILGHENISTTAIYTEVLKNKQYDLIANCHPLYAKKEE